jgi:hypothetical protein
MPTRAFVIRFPNGDYEVDHTRQALPSIGDTLRRKGELWSVARITKGAITQDGIDTVHVEQVKAPESK